MEKGTVYLVGAGPGDPGLITWRGLEILRAADVIIYDRLVNPELLLEARSDARLIYVGKAASRHSLSQDEINQLLADEAKAGYSVCRLKGGDPFLFGRGGEEADHLVNQGIPFVVVPGVTSALAVPAYAGIPVTDRRGASSLAIVTGHEDIEKTESSVNWGALAQAADTLVVLMGTKNLREITGELLSGGRKGTMPAAVIRWGTTGRQRMIVSDLAHIADEVERRRLTAPAILVVGDVVSMHQRLAWFERRPLLGLRILVLRPRHQASRLADLLRDAGAEPIICPVIRIEPIAAEKGRLTALMEQGWNWVLFTSANGVDCFEGQLRSAGLDWRALAGASLGAIGEPTAAALEGRGLKVDFISTQAISDAMGKELPGISSETRVLLPRAVEARGVLPEILRKRGAHVETVQTYRVSPDRDGALQLPDTLEKKKADVVTFTSSSMVRAAVEAVGAKSFEGCVVACIGPVTAQTARECGLRVDIEAKVYTIPGLMETLEAYVKEHGKQDPHLRGDEE
ncbi:MAG: uroporphyrinogen-III C-methyltransferase [Armatimonadetes bacterium]|nr:uroporphyrinogen-III C-methyltransferase [Armatimonadota bacterium]NIM23429.1 uroporphyrinogen-III C-methyltransferase [Armatimonadota bacterium]NIM67294.1 uroporphyrinogen-III C-methyltransferase [Armatimonadota bacterium]NIM75792.1 uroporphyrinogen-III C-methyltransferase [Armatimonadota bacterium]NIN05480.1 uroporphyrinogen-III C-methyltransferase [Armatimonadota bacterium]